MTALPRTQTRWTYHDLDDLPADLERYEIWEGELIILTMSHSKNESECGTSKREKTEEDRRIDLLGLAPGSV